MYKLLAAALLLAVGCVSAPQINSPIDSITFAYIQITETAKQTELARRGGSITLAQALTVKSKLQIATNSVRQAEALMCIITVNPACVIDAEGAQSKVSRALSITQLIRNEVSE